MGGGTPIQGRQLGAYRIGVRLGAGGIGAVHAATHVRTGRTYAVKILLPESALEPRAMARFRREAEALAALGHASIVAIHDFDVTDDGIGFLVMDRLEGEDLSARLERGALQLEDALRVLDEVAEALGTAHEAGILHRDLKPSNVFLARRAGAPERAVLLDFGLAKMIGGEQGGRLTASGATMGTPMYMSPEQAQGLDVGVESDVYSLAAILFEMLTATPPFSGPTITAILSKVLMQPPPLMRSIAPHVPEALESIVRRALAKDPHDRPASVRAFQAKVHRAAVGVAATTPKTQRARPLPKTVHTPARVIPQLPVEARLTPAAPPTPRRSWLTGLVVGALLGSLAMVGWVLSRDPGDNPDPVEPTLVTTPIPIESMQHAELNDLPENQSPENQSPENQSPENQSPENQSPENQSTTANTPPPTPMSVTPMSVTQMSRARTKRTTVPDAVMNTLPPGSVDPSTVRNAQAGVERARQRIAKYEAALPTVELFRRGLGTTTRRPSTCASSPSSRAFDAAGLQSTLANLNRSLERLCGLFDAWEQPAQSTLDRIERLQDQFARARRELAARAEDLLTAAQRDSLIREMDAFEAELRTSRRFPCLSTHRRRLHAQARDLGPRAAQPALSAARAIDGVCSSIRHSQIESAHRQHADGLDTAESVIHANIQAQRQVVAGLQRALSLY